MYMNSRLFRVNYVNIYNTFWTFSERLVKDYLRPVCKVTDPVYAIRLDSDTGQIQNPSKIVHFYAVFDRIIPHNLYINHFCILSCTLKSR